MSRDALEEERKGILRRLFDAAFGRRDATEEEIGKNIHRLGTVDRRLRKE